MLVVILGSVFFAVGSQNNIRMYVALSILLSGLLLLFSSKGSYLKSISIFLIIFSFFVHWSTIFIQLFIILSFSVDYLFFKNIGVSHLSANFIKKLFFFTMGTIGVLAFIFATYDKSWIYFNQSIISNEAFIEAGRSSNSIKLIYILILFTISSLLTFKYKINDMFINLRGNFLLFIVPFCFILPVEGFARLIFIYFAFECVTLAIYSSNNIFYIRLSYIIVFLFYSFALNAINVVSGINYFS